MEEHKNRLKHKTEKQTQIKQHSLLSILIFCEKLSTFQL